MVLSCTVSQFLTILITVADPDHQIGRGGGGGGHPDPKISGGGGGLQNFFFDPSGVILVEK